MARAVSRDRQTSVLAGPQPHGGEGALDDIRAAHVLPGLGGHVVEGQPRVAILGQTLGGLVVAGLHRPHSRPESEFPEGALADGEELGSNPLSLFVNDLLNTRIVVGVAWRIAALQPLVKGARCLR